MARGRADRRAAYLARGDLLPLGRGAAPLSRREDVRRGRRPNGLQSRSAMPEQWSMKGAILGECNCDWGCPCNFDVAPTYGNCDGVYVWSIDEGRYGDVDLAGARFAF